MTTTNQLSLLALFSGIMVATSVLKTPQGIYSDPAWQLESMQQYMEGFSPSINHTVTPLPEDLSKNMTAWGTWWPPGTQILVYPMARKSIPIGVAVRFLVVMALLLGSVGWSRWIALFDLPFQVKASIVFLFPWIRYSSNALFLYSPEILLFATSPWFLVAVWHMSESWWTREKWAPVHWFLVATLGLALGFRYWLKYSGILLSFGLLAYLAWKAFRSSARSSHWPKVAVLFATTFIPVAGLCFLNSRWGHTMNGAAATAGCHWRWETLLAMVANPALAVGDCDAVLRYFLLNPNGPLVRHETWIRLLGLPGGLLLWTVVIRRRISEGPGVLAITTLCSTLVSLGVIWTFSHSADFAARHTSSSGMAMMPLVLQEGLRWWRETSFYRVKKMLAAGALVYVVAPLVYGYVSVFGKIIRTPEEYVPGPAHIYNPSFATVNVNEVRRQLLKDFNSLHDIWYLTEPMTALELPGREVVRHADFEESDILRLDHFKSRQPLRVRALLPQNFETNGKGEIIRGSFEGAGPWTRQTIEGSGYVLWTALLRPVGP